MGEHTFDPKVFFNKKIKIKCWYDSLEWVVDG
jgi:hypothetical protein